jgi:hypothetical protein
MAVKNCNPHESFFLRLPETGGSSQMPKPDPHEVTQLLLAWSRGDKAALDRLMPLVYGELRRLAKYHMRRERAGHTLQTTALIHEAYLRLIDAKLNVIWIKQDG